MYYARYGNSNVKFSQARCNAEREKNAGAMFIKVRKVSYHNVVSNKQKQTEKKTSLMSICISVGRRTYKAPPKPAPLSDSSILCVEGPFSSSGAEYGGKAGP